MTSALLTVDHLTTWLRSSHGVVQAVDDVSFELPTNTTIGVVGESGSGKSVMMRSIMGLMSPALIAKRSGTVVFDGVDLGAASRKALRKYWGRDIAIVLQDPMTSLNPAVRIGRQLTEGLRVHTGLGRGDAQARGVELLESVGIPEAERRLRQYPHELSGGMRQRVTIAMALSCGPRLLIADEPTTALDVTVQAQILELLAEQQILRDMSMLLVTHDLGVVAGRTSEIIVMYAGQIVEKAPTRTLFKRPRMPYTVALMDALPRLENDPHTPLRAIPGRPPDLRHVGPECRFSPRCPRVQPRCLAEAPPLVSDGDPAHLFACWYPVEDGARDDVPAPSHGALPVSEAEVSIS